jgi:hypothetical protein
VNNEKKAPVLTLEHLAPYLPYGIRAIVDETERNLTAVSLDSPFVFVSAWQGSREKEMVSIEDIKPILRPLSDLTKEIEHNGESFVPIVELFKMRTQSTGDKIFDYYIENDTAILRLEGQQLDNLTFRCFFEVDIEPGQVMFSIASETWDDFGAGELIDESINMCGNEMMMFKKLYSWHFDMDDLIGSGLAIDINYIRKETKGNG